MVKVTVQVTAKTAQKAKVAIPQFWATGIIEIEHQNDVIQMHLQKAGCIHSSLSFLR